MKFRMAHQIKSWKETQEQSLGSSLGSEPHETKGRFIGEICEWHPL